MAENSYGDLVQTVFPHVAFFKSKKRITKENKEELMESLIYDDDFTEDDIKRLDIRSAFPLSITNYPSVLKRMTANQAGWWAINKCRNVGWKVDEENIRCCLAQLEMDM